MQGIVKGLVGFLLRSLFTSFLMFIMVISLVSGKFPPDLMDVRKTLFLPSGNDPGRDNNLISNLK
jgi:hypothetical protein